MPALMPANVQPHARGLVCPVCRAPFRGERECARCGADLGALMHLLAASWSLRQRARRALRAGLFADAVQLARDAADVHACAEARDLALLTSLACAAPTRG